ncbi:MAG: restriction endonuclease [Candidatus Bathyarchaeota archaeon]|nr:MAG: restriction endonuclease [Candidatus Bathyarchaeota archaeon]
MNYTRQTVHSLAETAEVLVRGRGYQIKTVEKNDNCVDVISTLPKSKDEILIRIITEPNLDSGTIGKQLVEEMQEHLEEEDYAKAILIGKSFTAGARSDMKQEDIEFINKEGNTINMINPLKLYPRIQTAVDNLCKTRCGKIPKSEKQCKGYNPNPKKCPTCNETGTIKKKGRENKCPECKGKAIEPRYTCDIRLLSDNADFHLKKGWTTLLKNDLEQLLKLQTKITTKPKLSEKIMKILTNN